MNPFFNWLKDPGTQAMLVFLGFLIACVAAVAGILAAKYAKAAPTREDLGRVEQHTAATSEKLADVEAHLATVKEDIKRVEGHTAESSGHLDDVRGHLQTMNLTATQRAERDDAMEKAQAVSITVWGEGHPAELFRVHLAPRDPDAVLTRIGLYNEHGSCFGSIDCARESDAQFGAVLTPDQFGRWMAGATHQNTNRGTARLRVYMSLDGRDGYREMSVSLFSGFVTRSNVSSPVNQIDGKV